MINMFFCVFVHHVLIFVLHLLFANIIAVTCCAMSFLALRYCYLAWCVTPCLVLLLLTMMCGPHFAMILLFAAVCHPSHYVVIICCGASSLTLCCYYALPLPCTIVVIYCGLLLLLMWFIALCLVLLLFIMVHCFHFALLLFVVVHILNLVLLLLVVVCHPSLRVIVACCDVLPSSCIITTHYGLSLLALCDLLFLALFCYFIVPCLFQVLTSLSLMFLLLFVVICHSLLYATIYLLR